jgi:A118 family predicted phage portal protein
MLPIGGKTAWPPIHLEPVLAEQKLWSAWASASPDRLTAAYATGAPSSGANAQKSRAFFGSQTGEFNRLAQYRGGIQGVLARMWWGQPTSIGEKRTKLHVPLASDICATSADQIFSKPPRFTAKNASTQKRLDEFADDGFHAKLLETEETKAAKGGTYLRVCYDLPTNRAWLSTVAADLAVPTFSWGQLVSVIFHRVIIDTGSKVVRHLEYHGLDDRGRRVIQHGVYEGDQTELGDPRPLTDYPETAPLVANLGEDGLIVLPEGCPPLVVYVPNQKPSRIWDDLPGACELGRADFQGAEGLMDALDETYSDLMRDMRLSKKRLMVPTDYMNNLGKGKGQLFDADQEIFVPIKSALGEGGAEDITATKFAIAVDEHLKIADNLVEQILGRSGYSIQSFGDYREGAAPTATEVNARERRTLTTRGKKLLYWRPGLADYVYAQLFIEQHLLGADVVAERPEVDFPPAVQPDRLQLAQTALALYNAKAASIETLVRMVNEGNPNADDKWVIEEVDRILKDSAATQPVHLMPGQPGEPAMHSVAGQPPHPPQNNVKPPAVANGRKHGE